MILYRQPSASSEDVRVGEVSSTITTSLPMAAVCHLSFSFRRHPSQKIFLKKTKTNKRPPWAMGGMR